MLRNIPIVLSLVLVICSLGTAYAQNREALPERECGALDAHGRCGGASGSPPVGSDTTTNRRQVCQSSCNNVYSHCLLVSSDLSKERCNQQQVFCMKAC
jgi:hypothetical protein